MRTLLSVRRFSVSDNLLYGIAKKDGYLLVTFFSPAGLSRGLIRRRQRESQRLALPSTPLATTLAHAYSEARKLSADVVATEHLLLALVKNDLRVAALLGEYGLTHESVLKLIQTRGVAEDYVNLTGFHLRFYKATMPSSRHRSHLWIFILLGGAFMAALYGVLWHHLLYGSHFELGNAGVAGSGSRELRPVESPVVTWFPALVAATTRLFIDAIVVCLGAFLMPDLCRAC